MQGLAQRIASIEIWLVGALVIASLFWSQLLYIVVATIFIFLGIRKLAYGYYSLRTPVDWGVLISAGMALLSLGLSFLPQVTSLQVVRLLSGIALFYTVVNWSLNPKRLTLLVIFVVLLGIGLAIFALLSVEWSFAKIPIIPATITGRLNTLVADTVNPNVMAGNLILFAPICFSFLVFSAHPQDGLMHRKRFILLVFLAFFLITLVIVMTLSRTAWIALLIALILISMLRWRSGWIVALVFFIFIAGYIYIFPQTGITESLLTSQSLGSMSGRLEVWTRAIFMLQDFPLTGIGMGTFKDLAVLYYPFGSVSVERITHAHNLYLQIALDLGLPGLIAWLSILIGVMLVSLQLYFAGMKSKERWWAALGAGFLGSMFALTIGGLFDAVIWGGVRPAPVVWMLWGCVFAYWRFHPSIQSKS